MVIFNILFPLTSLRLFILSANKDVMEASSITAFDCRPIWEFTIEGGRVCLYYHDPRLQFDGRP